MTDPGSEWFADEEFWRLSFDFLFADAKYQQAREQVSQIVALLGWEPGSLLDVGCGPGRFAVPFARRGFAVTGLDRSSFLIGKGRDYARQENVHVEWVEQDMRRFVRLESFDTAISMFSSFGYFEDPEENLAVLRNIHRSLRAGGALLMDLAGKEVVARHFVSTDSHELPGGVVLFERRTIVDDWSRIENRWTFLRGGETRELGFRLWLYSGAELKRLLVDAGFGPVELLGSLDGTPYGLEADRLIAVTHKRGEPST